MNTAAAPFDLTVSRHIRAPRERVFDAFVDPEQMQRWMCPRGMSVAALSVDARVGGRYRLTMRSRDGEDFTVAGEYRELVRPERLVYTWQWQREDLGGAPTLVSVAFVAAADGTEVRVRHSGFGAGAERDAHESGWQSTLNNLVDRVDERGSAASLTLVGDPRSSYVRTARMALAEKGVRYTLLSAAPSSPEVTAIHPFARIPALRDGDFTLFETSAIVRYVDEAFAGPPLLPGGARERARAEAWISAVSSYYYDPMVRRYVLQYIFPRGAGGQPDRAVIDAAASEMQPLMRALDAAYGARDWLAGNQCSAADLFVAPILAYVELFPEGQRLLAEHANVRRAQAAIRARASFAATQPA